VQYATQVALEVTKMPAAAAAAAAAAPAADVDTKQM
jgi:hypothetical protein